MPDGHDSFASGRRFHPHGMSEPGHGTEAASNPPTAQDRAWIDRALIIVAIAEGHLEIPERGPRVVRAELHALPVLRHEYR